MEPALRDSGLCAYTAQVSKSMMLVLLMAVAAAAQTPPTFSTGTRLVQVDAVVRDSHGPVAGLTKDDFTVLDNGTPQKIAVFAVRSARMPEVKAAPLPPGAVSNRYNRRGEVPSSATILLIDRQNTGVALQKIVNQKIVKFLQARGNRDSIGIYILGSRLRIVQELTDDPERLDRAVKSMKPEFAAGLTTDIDADTTGDATSDAMITRALEGLEDVASQERAAGLQEALEEIARHLAKVPGRKNLVWVSGSFPLFISRDHYTLDFSPQMEAAGRALNDANVAVYPVDARGLVGTLSLGGSVAGADTKRGARSAGGPGVLEPPGFDTMNTLASLTGGQAYYNTNAIEDSIVKAVEDAEITYTLGFYPPEGSLDGMYHKLTVKVSRRAGSVHHRRGYFASATGSDPDQGVSLEELFRDPLDATGLGLLAQAIPDGAKPGSFEVRVRVDLNDLQLARSNGRRTGGVDVSFLVAGTGQVHTKTFKIDIPDDQFAATLERGLYAAQPIETDGQAKDLRVVARDLTTGAAGSVRVELAAKRP